MNMDKIYNGQIRNNIYNILCIDDIQLCEDIDNSFEVGDILQIVYYITDKKVYNLRDLLEAQINCQLGIVDKLYFILDAYSEYTIEELQEDFILGGHNIIDEISTFQGKYIFMIIKKIEKV
jgi:hypothetical protein